MSIDLHDTVEVDKRRELRKLMRKRRRSLSASQLSAAAHKLFHRVAPSHLFRFSRRIAFSIARQGEIDPDLLLRAAQKRGKKCYLPVMSNIGGRARLQFRAIVKNRKLVRNNMGMLEPARTSACKPLALSLVLMPLVAFDPAGNRLGMGKGYYDRTFAFLHRSVRQRPVLLGLAHDFQKVDELEVASWDVPLQGVVTDAAWYDGRPAQAAGQ